ncbi:unnamed protein product [Closterium sp. NIES-53]
MKDSLVASTDRNFNFIVGSNPEALRADLAGWLQDRIVQAESQFRSGLSGAPWHSHDKAGSATARGTNSVTSATNATSSATAGSGGGSRSDGRTRKVEGWREQQQALYRIVDFWRRAVHLYGSYKLCQVRVRLSRLSEEQRRAVWEEQHERGAEILHSLCTEMQGFFLKAGQFLAKPDMSPPAWVRRLAPLHDSAPADPFPLVRRTVEAELARADVAGSDVASAADVARVRLEDVFAEFEEEPVGSASIAQVHRGRLKDGRRVAIKVQRAGAERLMLMDLANLRLFGAFLQRAELKVDLLGPISELEQQHAAVPCPVSGPFLPALRTSHSSLLASLPYQSPGCRPRASNPSRIFAALSTAYGRMLLQHGHFQADPHPGNILVCAGGRVALLDYGQTKQLPEALRLNLARLVVAIADEDMLVVGSCFRAMGIETAKTAGEHPNSFRRMAMIMFDTGTGNGVTSANPFGAESSLKSNAMKRGENGFAANENVEEQEEEDGDVRGDDSEEYEEDGGEKEEEEDEEEYEKSEGEDAEKGDEEVQTAFGGSIPFNDPFPPHPSSSLPIPRHPIPPHQILMVDFDFFDAQPSDYHGVKALLRTFLDGKRWDLPAFVDAVTSGTPGGGAAREGDAAGGGANGGGGGGSGSVATVVKAGDEGNILGLTACLPLLCKSKGWTADFVRFLHEGCDNRAQWDELWKVMQRGCVGVVVCERVANLPFQLVPHLFRSTLQPMVGHGPEKQKP